MVSPTPFVSVRITGASSPFDHFKGWSEALLDGVVYQEANGHVLFPDGVSVYVSVRSTGSRMDALMAATRWAEAARDLEDNAWSAYLLYNTGSIGMVFGFKEGTK